MAQIKTIQNFTNYNHELSEKKYICLHTTAGHGANNVINWWKTRNDGKGTISTPYLIARDGTIYSLFSPQYWSHHTGKGVEVDKQTIGIEIENAGVCTMNDSYELYNDIGVMVRESISWVDEKDVQHYHEEVTFAQWKSLVALVNMLSTVFNIPQRLFIGNNITLDNNNKFGIFTHKQINNKKSDIPIEVLEDANRNMVKIPFL